MRAPYLARHVRALTTGAVLLALVAAGAAAPAAAATVPGNALGTAPAGAATETTDPTNPGATTAPADQTDPGAPVDPSAPPATMKSYDAADFQALAEQLPAELGEAVQRDLGESTEDYLARAAAAVDAAAVVGDLTEDGVGLLGSRLEGTELVVNVASPDDVPAVEAVGARAELGEPVTPDYSGATLDALGDLVGGQGFSFTTQEYTFVCSVGFNGRTKSGIHLHEFITSGHCIEPNRTFGTDFYESRQSSAGASPSRAAVIGSPIDSLFLFGNGADVGPVITAGGWNPQPAVSTWGGGQGALTDGNPIRVTDYTPGIVGAPICKSGRTTGWTCGQILVVNESFPVYNHSSQPRYVNLTLTDVCMRSGDSGSAAVIGTAAFGLGTAGDWVGNCDRSSQPNAISAFFPMITTDGTPSITTSLPDWELTVDVATPVVNPPTFVGDAIRGTVANVNPRTYVRVVIDGSPYAVTPDASGAWSVPIPSNLTSGTHSYTVNAGWGTISGSGTVSGTYSLKPRPTVQRISGPDRYDVAVQISRQTFPGTAPVVYLAAGGNYPDALSAAPAAVHRGGPLLLTLGDQLPAGVADELRRLRPSEVVIVGGANSVGESVADAVRAIVPSVRRLAGSGRYETSQLVVRDAFPSATRAYVATGQNFPDALSASAAAGSSDIPVLLVQGSASTLDDPTRATLSALGVQRATIAGGPNSVTEGIRSQLASLLPGGVDRQAGVDRFEASVAINRAAFSSSQTVYIATGYNFPDALAGGVLAGVRDAPLYIVPTNCVPRGVLTDIVNLRASTVVLLGGPVSLTASVEQLASCS
ncbi:cell wall-binding repeat-containing protein [Herbiconiux solani]|uniref:cell wall-binding repeat-containing protein n=1 Tax=Herbiconiux solani TaxID=661329 RepID=UPI000825660C|nr:cell wall-binding repeat-containing protein [Herbiconiux solani]